MKPDIWMHNAVNILAWALGVLVGQSSGGQLAMSLEATISFLLKREQKKHTELLFCEFLG